MHRHPFRLLLPFLLLAACRDAKVEAYRVPKERDADRPVAPAAPATAAMPEGHPALPPDSGMSGAPVVTAGGPGLVWSAPASWQPKPLGPMRKGSFTTTDDTGATADLSITAFPGAVGGELANINRWRGQLALPPITESELAAAVTRLNQNGLSFTLIELAGADAASPQRLLGAMVPHEGAMWFFKLTGPTALVATAKPAFLDFLKTVKAANP